MTPRDKADWEFWKRVAKILDAQLHGWSYRDCADFVNPQMEISGRVAIGKLMDEIERLKGELAAMRFNNA